MATIVPSFFNGCFFGAALTASSIYLPSVILSQLSLTSTYVLRCFLTASACSTVIVYFTNHFTEVRLPPRTNTSYGWFSTYDANIVGGLLQGIGMALTGASPGIALVQLALGMRMAWWVVMGGILGALAFVLFGNKIRRSGNMVDGKTVAHHTVQQLLEIKDEMAVLGYEIMLVGVIGVVGGLGSSQNQKAFQVGPVAGGLMIGVAQAVSVLLSRRTLGISTAYVEIATLFYQSFRSREISVPYSNIVFAVGITTGAWVTSQRTSLVSEADVDISVPTALLGGVCTIFGARLAGGCTSGHGISGMSTLSVSSFVTMAAMFAGGVVFKHVWDMS